MKTLLPALVLILIICLSSCDGRDRVYKTNNEILKENNLLNAFSESITYIPETYIEIVTDTILSNGFHIKMKTYSNMEKNVLNTFEKDTIIHKEFYREFVSEVIITKNSKEIFNETVDKNFLNKLKTDLKLSNTIVKLMVDETSSLVENKIVLSAMIQNTDSKKISFCDIIINSNGKLELKEVPELYAYSN